MKDIDFDELDRAVSSVLDSNKQGAQPEKVSDTPALSTTDTPSRSSTPVSVPPAHNIISSRDILSAPSSETKEQPSVKPLESPKLSPAAPSSPAAKRAGRFMDVVHPSSDMKTSVVMPSKRVTLAPLSATIAPDVTPQVATPESPVVEAEAPKLDTLPDSSTPRSEASDKTEDTSERWPDPLDIVPVPETHTAPMPVEEEAKLEVIEKEGSVEDTQEVGIEQTNATPFLSDTKVDKRPLGAFAGEEAEAKTDENEAEPEDDPQLIGTPASDAVTTLPRELDADLVAVDAQEVAIPEQIEQEAAPAPSTVVEASGEPQQPAGPPSIPQQYKTNELAADAETHPIFDTNSYHQPLIPSKTGKKHTVLWIVIILALVLVGVGLGVAWYMTGF